MFYSLFTNLRRKRPRACVEGPSDAPIKERFIWRINKITEDFFDCRRLLHSKQRMVHKY